MTNTIDIEQVIAEQRIKNQDAAIDMINRAREAEAQRIRNAAAEAARIETQKAERAVNDPDVFVKLVAMDKPLRVEVIQRPQKNAPAARNNPRDFFTGLFAGIASVLGLLLVLGLI